MFAKTLKACHRRVAEQINKCDFIGIGFAFSWTQVMRKVLAEIFEKSMREEGIDQISDHRLLLCIESSSDFGKRVLSVQIRSKTFDPPVDRLAFHLERTLVIAKIDAIGHRHKKSISLEFW